jgi:hypothetical protein
MASVTSLRPNSRWFGRFWRSRGTPAGIVLRRQASRPRDGRTQHRRTRPHSMSQPRESWRLLTEGRLREAAVENDKALTCT